MKIGKVSESVLKRSVLRQIKTRRDEVKNGAGVGEDCAIFALKNTDSFMSCVQEGIVSLPTLQAESDIAASPISVLIQRCANNLAAGGALITAAMIGLVLPTSVEESDIKVLMAEAEAKCTALNVQIAGGQTRVSSAVLAPIAVITGYGKPFDGVNPGKAGPGQDVIVTKWIGLEGTAILADRYRERLLERYPAYFIKEALGFERYLDLIPEAATAVKSGVCAMHDVSEGGIFAALWELAEKAGVGLTIDLKKLPLRQETVEVCEYCEVNPYELLSGGCLLMICPEGEKLVETLQMEGAAAVVVGKTTDSKDRILINEDEVRYMDRPKQDAIYSVNL